MLLCSFCIRRSALRNELIEFYLRYQKSIAPFAEDLLNLICFAINSDSCPYDVPYRNSITARWNGASLIEERDEKQGLISDIGLASFNLGNLYAAHFNFCLPN